MRRSWVWDSKLKKLIEISPYARLDPKGPLVVGDLPGYQSPVTGLWVEGRKARREDLKRSNSRPWEGMDSERKEAQRRLSYDEQKRDARLDRGVREIYHQMPLAHRRAVEER